RYRPAHGCTSVLLRRCCQLLSCESASESQCVPPFGFWEAIYAQSAQNLFRFGNDFGNSPSLVLGQRTGFGYQHGIALVADVFGIMRFEFDGAFYDLIVKGV